jgi:prepilin-type N-terminal cleavage/methylation domain-containing protein
MSNKLSKRNQGFTIIEVMIVLAIAGIIMLIVFLAVPALQRNSRNTQRRTDASHLAGLVNEWAANHQGQLPTDAQLVASDANEKFSITGTVDAVGNTTGDGTTSSLKVHPGTTCNTATNLPQAPAGTSTRSFSIHYKVETGSADADACLDG